MPNKTDEEEQSLPETEPIETLKERHDHLSRDIRKSGLGLLTYCFFCALSLGQVDGMLKTGNIIIPFANVSIKASSFMIIGPTLLIFLTCYLHFFISEWKIIKIPTINKLPFTFNMDGRIPRIFSFLTFYIISPATLYLFSLRASIWSLKIGFSLRLLTFTTVFVFILLLLKPTTFRLFKKFLLVTLFSIPSGYLVFSGFLPSIFPFDLSRSELQKANLELLNLKDANLKFSNLEKATLKRTILRKANLLGANLEGADLLEAKFFKANLERANLLGASLKWTNLRRANLKQANLQEANLEGANLLGANLLNANLEGTNLKETDLDRVQNLTCDQIRSALFTTTTRYPNYLEITGGGIREIIVTRNGKKETLIVWKDYQCIKK
jgi:hypothetical protein